MLTDSFKMKMDALLDLMIFIIDEANPPLNQGISIF